MQFSYFGECLECENFLFLHLSYEIELIPLKFLHDSYEIPMLQIGPNDCKHTCMWDKNNVFSLSFNVFKISWKCACMFNLRKGYYALRTSPRTSKNVESKPKNQAISRPLSIFSPQQNVLLTMH